MEVKVGETWRFKRTGRDYKVFEIDLLIVSFKSTSTLFEDQMPKEEFVEKFEKVKEA